MCVSQHAAVSCSILCHVPVTRVCDCVLLSVRVCMRIYVWVCVYVCLCVCVFSWLFPAVVVNKNSLNYCSSSDKSKRRTKTVKKSLEPKWNQTFMYSPVHRREFRERMLEITLWDQARVREEESEFLGEVSRSTAPSHCPSSSALVHSLPNAHITLQYYYSKGPTVLPALGGLRIWTFNVFVL